MAMSFNGPYRRPQLGCDLFIYLASNDKIENLSFTRGQQPHEATQTIQLAALIPPGLMKSNRPFDCPKQLFGGDRFGQKVLGAGLDCLHGGLSISMTGQKNDRQGRAKVDQAGLQVRTA